ncbi:ribonuclease 3-like protein 3 [Senna tora]|uniref:Ribonuclease 3-like protein 3 n=1 Tax=Senna tora TaxID=362788 RepID=A0A834T7H0_9FABA|nr:ribonuclease 3-like protein 3 [Senna tora]
MEGHEQEALKIKAASAEGGFYYTPTTTKATMNNNIPPSLHEVEEILGYSFKNKRLLEEAFTHHSSYCYNNNNKESEKCFSSKRLAYVGDAVLNLLVTKEQFFSYPNLSPGRLTRLRASNVDTEKLARVAIRHEFHRYLRHKKPLLEHQIGKFRKGALEYPLHSNGLIEVPKALADIVESTIGALYIDSDSNIDSVWKIFRSLLEPIIDPDTLKTHPVTELYEVCQKMNWKVQFVDLWNQKMAFYVLIDNHLVGRGIYGTKKEVAYNRAAQDALDKIRSLFNNKDVWKKVWNVNVPPKVKCFVWRATGGTVPMCHTLNNKVHEVNDVQRDLCPTNPEGVVEANWKAPGFMVYKINVSAAINDDNVGGVGCVVRDYKGRCLAALAKKFDHAGDIEYLEAEAFLMGLDLAKGLRVEKLVVEGDAKTVVDLVTKQSSNIFGIGLIVEEIRMARDKFQVCNIEWTPRGANGVADVLANFAFEVGNVQVWLEDYPPVIADILYKEQLLFFEV